MVQVLSRELVKQQHEVLVAGLYGHRYGQKAYEEDQGVKIWRLRYGPKLPVKDESRWYNLFEKLPAWLRRMLNGRKGFDHFITFLNDLIDREKVDVIEIQDWNTFTHFVGFQVDWPAFKVPLVVKSNGSYTYFSNEMGITPLPEFNEIDKALYQRADALSAVSAYTAGVNKRLFSIDRDVQILYNCIHVNTLTANLPKEKARVIFTGTLIEKKGIFELMKSWNLVHDHCPEARLVVYGKGKTEPLRQLLSDAAKLTVEFKGHTTREALMADMATATMAIFPSYSECFALAPLEAMAVGCPVLNSARSSGPELVTEGVNGSLVDPVDIEGMAGKIVSLLNDPERQKLYSQKGFETVSKQFNICKSAQDHVAFYTQTIAAFRRKNEKSL